MNIKAFNEEPFDKPLEILVEYMNHATLIYHKDVRFATKNGRWE